MPTKYIYRSYNILGDADKVRDNLCGFFLSNGYREIGNVENVFYFKYPSIMFSSKNPFTCISRLSLDVSEVDRKVLVKIGVNFKKIRYFNITAMISICVLLPALLGYIKNGIPDIPPMAYLGIPLGILVHYHVRWRVFKALGRLVSQSEAAMLKENK